MKRYMLWLIAALVFCSTQVQAAPDAKLQDVIDTLEQGYQVLADVQADFSQRTTIAAMKREERGAGEMSMKKPAGATAMFRFNYTKPKQQIISNGKTVWYYLPDNKQVMVMEMAAMFEKGNGVALNYLAGMGKVSQDFTVSFAGDGRDKKGNYVLDLVPKSPTQALSRLQLTISAQAVERFLVERKPEEPFPILTSVVYDQLGNRTAMDYSRVRVNRGMRNDRFTFKVPAGVEVIRNR
jgi:outer membrane lipoprotein carrier protein